MKNLFSYLIYSILLLTVHENAKAQCNEPQSNAVLHGNDVRAVFRNAGDMFWDGNTPLYEVTVAPNKTINTFFAGALWLSGWDAGGNLRTSCQTYRATGTDFWAGPLNPMTGQTIDCAGFDKIWKVSGDDIRMFLNDIYDNNVIDNPIPTSILAWPGKGNLNSPALNNLTLPEQDLAPYVDVNMDNVYDPYAGDYPIADPAHPQVIADDLLWTVFNDNGGLHTATNGQALGVEVQMTAYSFNCSNDDLVNKTIFVRHKIINRTPLELFNFKAGLWSDFDLGCINDDLIGTIPSMNSVYVYNMDNDDDVNCGSVSGFGNNPPVQSITLLNQNMTSSMYHINSASSPTGDPAGPYGNYQLMNSHWSNAVPLTWGGDGYNPSSTDSTPYAFPDNPNFASGWSMHSQNIGGNDQRSIMSTSDIIYQAGEVFDLVSAYSLHYSADSNHLQNVNLMYQQIPQIQSFYDNGYNNGNVSCSFVLPIQKISTTVDNFIKVYPNPAKDMVTIMSPETPLESIELFNALGQSVYSKININNSNIQLPISNLPNGIYVLKVSSGTKNWSEKITITH